MRWIMRGLALLNSWIDRLSAKVRDFNRRMQDKYEPAKLAAIATAVLALGFIVQIMLPPYLGVSNDGSFDTVMQDVGLARMDPEDTEAYFSYYEREYLIAATADPPGTTPMLLRGFVRAAIGLDMLLTGDTVFDMRFLAGLYGVCYLLVAFLLLKNMLERAVVYSEGIALAVAGVLIMGDTALVTRFASLYTQPLEWILLMGIVDAVFAIGKKAGKGAGPVTLCFLVALMMSINVYFALAGLVFSTIFWRLLGMKVNINAKTVYALMALALTVISVFQVASLTANQTPGQKYNQMTRGVLFQATNPEKTLAEFGIEPRYSLLADTYSDQDFPVALMDSQVLEEGFFDQYQTKDILVYYVRHPMALLGLFDIGVQESFVSRPSFSGNFEKRVGLPPMAKSPFPTLWSTFKEQTAPKTVGSVFILLMVIALLRHRKKDVKTDTVALTRSMLDVVLLFAALEMMTVLMLSGDSELITESFLLGSGIDLLVMIFLMEILHKTNIVGQEEG